MENLVIENARLIFKNLSGRETKFNREGNRNFCVRFTDPEVAQNLIADGWNIHMREAREEGEDPLYYLQVAVKFDNIPPKVVLVTSRNKVRLDAETVGELDTAQLKTVDLVIRPYNWEVNGKTGIKAYLKTMYAVLEEDEFAAKYADEESPEDETLPF